MENFLLDEYTALQAIERSVTSNEQRKWITHLAELLLENASLLSSLNIVICACSWLEIDSSHFGSTTRRKISKAASFVSELAIPVNDQYLNANFAYSVFLRQSNKTGHLRRDQLEKLEEIIKSKRNIVISLVDIIEDRAEKFRNIIDEFFDATSMIDTKLHQFYNGTENVKNIAEIENDLKIQFKICQHTLSKKNEIIRLLDEMKLNLEQAKIIQRTLPKDIHDIYLL